MAEPLYPSSTPHDGHTAHLPAVPPDAFGPEPAGLPVPYTGPPASYAAPAGSYPGPMLPMPVEQVIAQIGEIQVTSTTVRTPVGVFGLRGSRWQAQDQWIVGQKTPTWAIVCAIVGFCCLTFFSLLFLLAKETVYSGVVHVTVTSGRFQYDARIGVANHAQVQHIHNLVNYVRSLAAA
jgi:hypothetical protein